MAASMLRPLITARMTMPSGDRAGTNEGDDCCEGAADVSETGCRKMPLRSLSRMRREAPVRFLGDSATMHCGYPIPRYSGCYR